MDITDYISEIKILRQKLADLEIQNEELRHLWAKTEVLNDKYTGLYDFTPTGYFMLSLEGKIIELNLSGANMLGKERGYLKNQRFSFFVSTETVAAFNIFLNSVFQSKVKESCEVTLTCSGKSSIFVHLTGIAAENGKQCFITVIDITGRKLAESHRDQQLIYTTALNEIAEVIISNDNSDIILESANRILGETMKLDRALIYDISFSNGVIIGLCEWLKNEHPDIATTKDRYPVDMFLVPFTEIKNTRKYLESQYDAVGEFFSKDDSGRILHEQFKIKSLIWYPFAFYDGGYYLFTINQVLTSRLWKPEEFDFIESVAKLISLALMKIKLLDDREKTEEDLQEMLAELQTSQKIAHLGNWKLDLASNIFTASQEGLRIFGFPPDSHPTFQEVSGCIHSDDIARVSEVLKSALITGEPYTVEFRINRKNDGALRHVLSMGNIQFNSDSTPMAVFGINQDITDRKIAEELLHQTKLNYKTFFNRIDDLLFVLDETGKIIHTNLAVTERLGYRDDELSGQSVLMIHPPAYREEAARTVLEMLNGITNFCPCPVMTKTGIEIPVETRISKGFWDGKPVFFGITRDITELRIAENKIRKLNETLMLSSRQ